MPGTSLVPADLSNEELRRRLDYALDLLAWPHADDEVGYHHRLARALDVDHGAAVLRARTVCASGNGAGAHGSTSPCDRCTTNAVRSIARENFRNAREERTR